MNKANNQIRREEFEKRRIYKGSKSFCQEGYDCPVFMNCLLEINQLKKQLEERDNVIDKVSERLKLLGKYDGETCTRNFKMMSADFNHLLEILERGANNEN